MFSFKDFWIITLIILLIVYILRKSENPIDLREADTFRNNDSPIEGRP